MTKILDIKEVLQNTETLFTNTSSLAVLKDFERVLDELDIYVFDNWYDGELAYGPHVSRHWIRVGFMWPYENKPDIEGAKRLASVKCRVKYSTSSLIEVQKIRTPDDIRPGTKKGKFKEKKVWLVEIEMPTKLAFDMYRGYINKMRGDLEKPEVAPKQTQLPQGSPIPSVGGMMPMGGGGMPVGSMAPTDPMGSGTAPTSGSMI